MLDYKKAIFHSWLSSIISCLIISVLVSFLIFRDYQNTKLLRQVNLLAGEYQIEDVQDDEQEYEQEAVEVE